MNGKTSITAILTDSEALAAYLILFVQFYFTITGEVSPEVGIGMMTGTGGLYKVTRQWGKNVKEKSESTKAEALAEAAETLKEGGRL